MMTKFKPAILLCSETRVTANMSKGEYSIDNYKVIECFSETRATGGVLIYIKNDIKYRIIINEVIEKMLWFLAIEIWNTEINGIYAVFYRSPNKDVNVELALNALDDLVNKTLNLNKLNIVVGDLNVDLNKRNKNAKMAKSILVKHDLNLCGNFITRDNNNSGTQIDIVVTNKTELVNSYALESEIISDHKTIFIEMKKSSASLPKCMNIISWKNYSKDDLMTNLSRCDWSNFYAAPINDKVQIIRLNLLNSVHPLTKMVQIKNNIKPKVWFDSELSQLKIEKINSYMIWLNDKSQINWQQYKILRNDYNRKMNQKRNDHTQSQIINAANDQKEMWKCIKYMISNKNEQPCDEIQFDSVKC